MAGPVHVRKAHFRGSETNVEAWRRGTLPPGAKCGGCGRAGCAIWVRVYYPLADFARTFGPQQTLLHAAAHGGQLPIYPTVFGQFVFVSEVFACVTCAPELERTAARYNPSWALVEVRRGPELTAPHSQVPRG